MQPPEDMQWAVNKVDASLYLEGSKAFCETSACLQAQGLRGVSNDYVLQHVDWVTLGQHFAKMSALQVSGFCFLFSLMTGGTF